MGNTPNKDNSARSDASSDRLSSRSAASSSIHGNILRQRKGDVFNRYKTTEVLGNGSMGFVAKAVVRDSKVGGSAVKKKGVFIKKSSGISERRAVAVEYALKSIQLDRVSPLFLQELRNEIDILKSLDHPNIVKAHEVYDNKKQIYIVLELCDGGDLYTRTPYSEKGSGKIIGKLLSAVKYMHDHGIVHRDLKYENIMFENDAADAEIKVIDFGLSKKFLSGDLGTMTEGVGTLTTMAPQVLQGVYTEKADLWSVGVIAYMLLSNHRPFYHKRRRVMIDRIMRADYTIDAPYWYGISDEAKQFVSQLLVVDPSKRLDAAQALAHHWLSNEFKLSDRKPTDDVADAVDESLVNYCQTSKLKKIALNVVAHNSSTKEILQLRKAFDQYDSGNDGVITYEEFKLALAKANYPEETLNEIFASIDVNNNGHIMYTEFLAATLEAHGHIEEERIAEAFDRLDSDDSGYISRANLKEFLGADATTEQIDEIINSADMDRDGKLSYKEFLKAFRSQTNHLVKKVGRVQSSIHDGDEELVGLDAKIPGGKFDSDVDEKYKSRPPITLSTH